LVNTLLPKRIKDKKIERKDKIMDLTKNFISPRKSKIRQRDRNWGLNDAAMHDRIKM
jgi:hypothetical protein